MDKQTFSEYGWIVISLILVAVFVIACPAVMLNVSDTLGKQSDSLTKTENQGGLEPPSLLLANDKLKITEGSPDTVSYVVTINNENKETITAIHPETPYDLSHLPCGTHKLSVIAKDAEDNESSDVFTYYVNSKKNSISETHYITDSAYGGIDEIVAIGATDPNYVIALYINGYKKVVIIKNGKDSDGKIMTSAPLTHKNSITSVVIRDGVVNIGQSLFQDCTKLQKVDMPDSVTSIHANAFKNCTSLTSVGISKNVTFIDHAAFENCGITSISVPGTVQSLGQYVFNNCTNLKKVTLSEGITSVGAGMFNCCTSLAELKLPNSLETINYSAFKGCIALQNVEIPHSVTEIADGAFYGCKKLTDIIIPGSVKTLGSLGTTGRNEGVFEQCENLESVIFADIDANTKSALKTIGDSTFYGCKKLTEITIPNQTEVIGQYAFESCENLVSVELSNRLKAISDMTFHNCSSLTSITVPSRVTSIGVSAFEGCSKLSKATLNNGLLTIKEYAFKDCVSLTPANTLIPASCIDIAKNAFEGCTGLPNNFPK